MRHANRNPKLSRSRAQRVALKKSLALALLKYEVIKTTDRKAKVASAEVDQLITLGKRNDLHARRQAYSYLCDHQMVKYLFDEIAPRFKDMNGGYTRVLKFIKRKGDDAQLSILELTVRKEKSAVKAETPAAEAEGEKKGLKGIFKKKAAKKAE
jgi:large subunit ribosomal protein L17